MDLLTQYKAQNSIAVKDVSAKAVGIENDSLVAIHDEFLNVVADIRAIIEHPSKPILRVAFSSGKDSSLVLVAAMEAYRQAIAEGKIESDRLLLIATIDTLIEALPMKFFVEFCSVAINSFAKKHNINAIHSIITPPLSSEFFIKYAGADKLVNNPTRDADCVSILKLDPAMKLLAKQKKELFAGKAVISLTGQRADESPRRLMNMRKQGVQNKAVSNVLEALDENGAAQSINFAPVRDWSTDDVFDFFRIIGTDALYSIRSVRKPVETYFSHFALLLELYGKASTDTCSLVVNASGQTESSGCGGSSERYGCNFCTRIVTDRSAESVSRKPYWDFLGTTDALRVRDWLFRISSNPEARTMHPKAVDPAFNRIMFQNNTLKSRYLDKILKYASQLTVNAQKKSEDFDNLIKRGLEHTHEGYKSIIEDQSINPKAKDQLLEMYKEGARKPYMPYFSLKHGMILSLKWNMLGVSAAPYRPLKIWDEATKGESIIPFPKLNSELPEEAWQMKSTPMIDPIVLRFHTKEFEGQFFEKGESFLSYHQRPLGIMDMFDNSNCGKTTEAKGTLPVKVDITPSFFLDDDGVNLNINIKRVLNAKSLKNMGYKDSWTIKNELIGAVKRQVFVFLKQTYDVSEVDLELESLHDLNKMVGDLNSVRVSIAFIDSKPLFNGFKKSAIKSSPRVQATRRVIINKGKKGPVVKSSTRCVFYPISTGSNYERKYSSYINVAEVNFETEEKNSVYVCDYLEDLPSTIEPIMFDEFALMDWMDYGGYEKALELHDQFVEHKIKWRNHNKDGKSRVRVMGNLEPISRLLNSAGMMINPAYRAQFEKTLKRTHLLFEIGAFELQALSKEDLENYSGTITMKQHRSDKAGLLLKVRAARNAERKQLKSENKESRVNPEAFAVNIAEKNMSFLFSKATAYISSMNHIEYNADLGLYIGGEYSSVAPLTQLKAHKSWFDMYNDALTSYDTFKTIFLGAVNARLISENSFSDLKLSRAYVAHQVSLKGVLDIATHSVLDGFTPMSLNKVERKIVGASSTKERVNLFSSLLKDLKRAS